MLCWLYSRDERLVLLRKIVCQVFKKPNMQFPYDPALTFSGIYPREIKSNVYTKPVNKPF